MARLYLVRHGRASAAYNVDTDPGLDELGREQADAAAAELQSIGRLPIVTSPMRRCRETAEPLAKLWETEAVVDQTVSEVVAPTDDLEGRGEWLSRAMATGWAQLEPQPQAWRQSLLETVRSAPGDLVIFTHFIAINAVIGAARGDDAVLQARVDNGSITVVEVDPGGINILDWGRTANTEVL